MSSDLAERYEAALQERGLEDVRPLYRRLLVRLKEADGEAYEDAVRRYREEVEPAVEEGGDPLVPWLCYGAWLARRLADGDLTAVAPDGSASTVEPGPGDGEGGAGGPDDGAGGDAGDLAALAPGTLLLHLPDDDGEPGFPLAVPADPSVYQEATRELLCG